MIYFQSENVVVLSNFNILAALKIYCYAKKEPDAWRIYH